MNTTACHYSIVRFMPFVETGEFGNVGIVLFSPSTSFFGFQVLEQRFARITNFFDQMEPRILRSSMRVTRDELQRVRDMLKSLGTDHRLKSLNREAATHLWQEILKPRESMVRFSDSRLVMVADPQAKISELFAYYVERNFATKQHQEKVLEQSVRGFLKSVHLDAQFQEMRVGNDEYDASFPFVELRGGDPVKAIKPLRLDHPNSAQIIDHGGQWRVRIEALKKRRLLPARVLFAINGNSLGETAAAKARREVAASLIDLGIEIQSVNDREAVLEFAKS